MLLDFHCQVCDKDFERIKLQGNHLQRRRICEPCREWFCWCNKCKRAKLFSDFDRASGTKNGVQGMCRACRIDITGLIRIRTCSHCESDCVVSNHNRYNGKTPWLCDTCYLSVKLCQQCGETKHIYEFARAADRRNGRVAHCRSCTAARWSASDHERRTQAKRRKLGLSYDAYLAMRVAQDNRCGICGCFETEVHPGGQIRELAIDHDHSTGRVRALLCGRCNKALGLMLDDPSRLRAAADYLESHAAQREPGEV
ncbi:endonuclease VII domain-containing protein (plasmid) [Nocardia sp. CA-151230]|uniref:endonuclease VII domain-containing protein n=1 Tax=Nocardia sp. CA-151230 TaxID=3239982 RepID=UPI003D93A2F3